MPYRTAHTVLMYHAVLAPEDDPRGADLHYAVRTRQFTEHLDAVRAAGQRPASVLQLLNNPDASAVAFTFDDGHESNAWAANALAQAGGAGDFFVNSATVGTSGFLSWDALRDMHQAGMSIQSHGHSHRYLDDLTPAEVHDELQRSKVMIEDRLGAPVTLFAPPGGRMPSGLQEVARALGYTDICSSRVGLWRRNTSQAADIPRLAVLLDTPLRQVQAWIEQNRTELLRQELRYSLLRTGKRLLGNGNYERLRGGLLKLASKGR